MSEKVTTERLDRLLYILKKLGLSERQFLLALGISPNWFSDMRAGRVKKFSDPILLLMQYRYGVNLDWLLSGDDEPFINNTEAARLTDDEKELLELYRATNPEGRRAVMITARGAALGSQS